MRVMVWNINRFTGNTLARNIPYNEWHIIETVYGQALDIFIVVEVQSGQGLRGSLINGGGRTGSLELLAMLRDEAGAPDWRLVPPLRLVQGIIGQNYTEGISVFYNNTTLDFVGPYYWNANQGVATAINAGTPYPNAWNGALPGGNNRAGKVDFTHYQNGNALEFPNANNRRPFYTEFVERGGAARTIKLLSAHLPPNQADGALGLNRISNITEIRNVGANEVVIVAGDFNFNLINIGQNHVNDVRAFSLFNLFLPVQFTPATGATRIADTNNATMAGVAPGYGYLLNEYLDNIFVRYGGGLAAPAHNPIVVNRVVGSGPNYPIDMARTIPQILADPNLDANGQLSLFREDYNYAHIARFSGVSDHLALVMDV
ncbi:MAG: hypothetical protein KDD67_15345 [Ignavibacteriae bacterium]|nr:hypothetical protein [Ignavibacteriota bacterium]MCB9217717.1 hypothetical protein [Ignavibacteria bacterium]